MHKGFHGPNITIALEHPSEPSDQHIISKALKLLEPYIVGLSGENAIKVLTRIEQHASFDQNIAKEVREQ